jgi:uncharacterized membrane protein YebE (DUF533 family)
MFDPKQLLNQVLGGGGPGSGLPGSMTGGMQGMGAQVKNRLDSLGGTGGFASGAAVGGVLGLLLGNKKVRKMGGGLLGYGGAAAVGALAMHAYQAYKRGQSVQGTVPMSVQQVESVPPAALPHAKPAADGSPFELVLVRAMVSAAKADGHIDAEEQRRLFSEVERMGLDSEAKAYVFDLLTKPTDLEGITSNVATQEQGAELYLASRLAINPDEPSERAYLDALAARLKLPAELRAHLDQQASA